MQAIRDILRLNNKTFSNDDAMITRKEVVAMIGLGARSSDIVSRYENSDFNPDFEYLTSVDTGFSALENAIARVDLIILLIDSAHEPYFEVLRNKIKKSSATSIATILDKGITTEELQAENELLKNYVNAVLFSYDDFIVKVFIEAIATLARPLYLPSVLGISFAEFKSCFEKGFIMTQSLDLTDLQLEIVTYHDMNLFYDLAPVFECIEPNNKIPYLMHLSVNEKVFSFLMIEDFVAKVRKDYNVIVGISVFSDPKVSDNVQINFIAQISDQEYERYINEPSY